MFAVVYRWRIIPGREQDFEIGWTRGTERIAAELGGWGSRLHRAKDGSYFAYAEWPDEATWRAVVEAGMPHSDEAARRMYRGAIEADGFEVICAGEVASDRLGLGAGRE